MNLLRILTLACVFLVSFSSVADDEEKKKSKREEYNEGRESLNTEHSMARKKRNETRSAGEALYGKIVNDKNEAQKVLNERKSELETAKKNFKGNEQRMDLQAEVKAAEQAVGKAEKVLAKANEVEIAENALNKAEGEAVTTKLKCRGALCLYSKPYKRLIAAGAIGGLSAWGMGAAMKQAKETQANIEALEKVRDGIVNQETHSLDSCSNNDFEDSEKLSCYCYKPEGGINYSRDPQGVCKALFPSSNLNAIEHTAEVPTSRGCVTLQGNFDYACKCRAQKKSGKNNCMKIGIGVSGGLGKNALGALGASAKGANSLLGGNYAGAAAAADGSYKRLAKLAKKIASKKLGVPISKIDGAIDNAILQQLRSPSNRGFAEDAGGVRDAGLASLASAMPASVRDSLDDSTSSMLANASSGYKKGRSRRSSRGSSKEDFDFNSGDEFAADFSDEEVNEIMDKKFAYNNSDIYQNPGASLFKVLSTRYYKSAYRRLFNKEEQIKADPAGTSDISN